MKVYRHPKRCIGMYIFIRYPYIYNYYDILDERLFDVLFVFRRQKGQLTKALKTKSTSFPISDGLHNFTCLPRI